jgi:hypothetical protein
MTCAFYFIVYDIVFLIELKINYLIFYFYFLSIENAGKIRISRCIRRIRGKYLGVPYVENTVNVGLFAAHKIVSE